MEITTLALPPLGCGLGGLKWPEVKGLIEKHLDLIVDLEVFVYGPQGEAQLLDESEVGRSQVSPRSDDGMVAQQSLFEL